MEIWKKEKDIYIKYEKVSNEIICLSNYLSNNNNIRCKDINCNEIHIILNLSNNYYTIDFSISNYTDLIDFTINDNICNNHIYLIDKSYINLIPIISPPDGNCLLHSVCISLFGVPDLELIFKKLLLHFLSSNKYLDSIKKYWIKELYNNYKNVELDINNEFINTEWYSDLDMITSNNSSIGSLGIFLLSHIIRRSIIIYSDEENYNIYGLDGLYIPFLLDYSIYNKNPIFLYYSNCHYTPLLKTTIENKNTIIIHNFNKKKPLNCHFNDTKINISFLNTWFNNVKIEDRYLKIDIID